MLVLPVDDFDLVLKGRLLRVWCLTHGAHHLPCHGLFRHASDLVSFEICFRLIFKILNINLSKLVIVSCVNLSQLFRDHSRRLLDEELIFGCFTIYSGSRRTNSSHPSCTLIHRFISTSSLTCASHVLHWLHISSCFICTTIPHWWKLIPSCRFSITLDLKRPRFYKSRFISDLRRKQPWSFWVFILMTLPRLTFRLVVVDQLLLHPLWIGHPRWVRFVGYEVRSTWFNDIFVQYMLIVLCLCSRQSRFWHGQFHPWAHSGARIRHVIISCVHPSSGLYWCTGT